jgi:hypothetical protein
MTPDDVHATVLDIWRRVLDDPSLDASADFFLNGGHSLLAVRLVDAVGAAVGTEVPIPVLFLSPTPAEFADAIIDLLRSEMVRAAAG